MDINYEELFNNLSDPIVFAMMIVVIAIIVIAVISLVISIVLAVSYAKYNRKENSAGLTGEETARKVLDDNGLQHIKVKTVGSLLFGNSYSHYFKKVRLRRRTKNKTSLTALAMGCEKAALAVLDKENDPDMKKRNKLIPIITFGPFAFIPLILIGVIIDVIAFNSQGNVTIIMSCVAILFYVFSLFLSIITLKTEKKAQERACELLHKQSLATEEEITDIKKLFKLYNIQYVNNIILSALELIYHILRIMAMLKGNGSSSTSNS